jgi:hypothetical protein
MDDTILAQVDGEGTPTTACWPPMATITHLPSVYRLKNTLDNTSILMEAAGIGFSYPVCLSNI